MISSNENTVSFSSENNKKKPIDRLQEGEEVNPQDASQVGSPKKRLAVVTSTTATGEDTVER